MDDLRAKKPHADPATGTIAGKVPVGIMTWPVAIFGSLLWILVASATLVESDAYRYAAALLSLIAFYYYLKAPVRPRTDWIGWLCMGWGAYVMTRFAITYWLTPEHDIGASDWLYAFPFFFPILGVAFLLYEPLFEKIIAAYFAAVLIMLIATQHFREVFAGETIRPLIMNNQIHGAVACGMIVIFTLFWLLHYLTDKSSDRRIARFAYIVSPFIVGLCFIAIYGAKSKGVWLALSITLPLLGLVALSYLRLKLGAIVIAVAAVLLIAGVYTVRHNLDKTAGPTVSATIAMLQSVTGGHDLGGAVSNTIGSTNTPVSMDERLQLWSNSWEVFSSAPVFGWGNRWLERWHETRYSHIQYTLLHNGYLEILVRYGLFGAAIMAFMLAIFIRTVWRAYKAAIIPRAAWHAYAVCLFFFSLTLLSNSNNRLAIGESLAFASSAFACWCNMRLKGERLAMSKVERKDAAAG
ncbi:O-antigen ligase domain-containing protein [Rhizobium lusitanum]|uniref:O-antigen ligase family protein n=1 Tax=Rhizobium lusitanum TaxID=293958 RepID=UPI00160E7BAB|nr:O-antigen ligase family protein [Rhizobium lusitanum]QND48891.1 O-antigen ligase domain-containing protein [Rhizobium lusitanum]